MHKTRIPLFVAIAALLASHIAAEEEDIAEQISITTSEPQLESTQLHKRDYSTQISSYNGNLLQLSSDDEPFRPMYPPFYLESQASNKYETRQPIGPRTAEIYYENSQSPNKQNVKAPITAPQTSISLPAHSRTPLAGSFISSGGGQSHHAYGYRGPLNNNVYQKEQQNVPQKFTTKQEISPKPVSPAVEANKQPQYTATLLETKAQNQKQYYQPQQYAPQLIFQRPHYHHRQYPFYPQAYHAEHSAPVRATPQHHIQYIVAIPLSHLRQLQQQHTAEGANVQQHAPPTAQSVKEHFSSYENAESANNPNSQADLKSTYQQPQQYTTQYVQLPASVLHAAIQAAHTYQQQQQQKHVHVQPHYVYYPQQQQSRQQYYEQNQQAPLVVSPVSEKLKSQQSEAVQYTDGTNSDANSSQQKEIRVLPTSLPVTVAPHTQMDTSSPVVHYNPVYVQGPPPDQQALFGNANYHRFTSGAFHATTPVPFIRIAPVTQPYSHYYSSLPPHPPPPVVPQQIHPFYRPFVQEQIPTHGLPYFTHPGGIHYGTHLYHPPTRYVASPSALPPKNVENTNYKQQQHHAQRSDDPNAEKSNTLVKYP